MPFALTIGVPHETFFKLVPMELKSFYKSYKQKKILRDREIWEIFGTYGISSFIVALDRCISRQKSTAEYIKEPIHSKDESNGKMTEEQMLEMEIKKAIEVEEKWILASKQSGLPPTII